MTDFDFDDDVEQIIIDRLVLKKILEVVDSLPKYVGKNPGADLFKQDFRAALNGEEVKPPKSKRKTHKTPADREGKNYTQETIMDTLNTLSVHPDYRSMGVSAADIAVYLDMPLYMARGIGSLLARVKASGGMENFSYGGKKWRLSGNGEPSAPGQDVQSGNGNDDKTCSEDTARYRSLLDCGFTRRLRESGALSWLYSQGKLVLSSSFRYSDRSLRKPEKILPYVESDIKNLMSQAGYSGDLRMRVQPASRRVEMSPGLLQQFRTLVDDIKRYTGEDLLRRPD